MITVNMYVDSIFPVTSSEIPEDNVLSSKILTITKYPCILVLSCYRC